MTSRRLITTLAAVAAGSALAAGPAAAAPYRSVAFDVKLKGSQVSTWEYHADTLKDDPCGSRQDAYGDQTLRFDQRTLKGRLLFGGAKGSPPTMVVTGGNGTTFRPFEVAVQAERTGTWVVDVGTQREGCGANGGGVEPTRDDKDCGTRYGWLKPRFEARRRGRIEMSGASETWATHQLGAIDIDGGRGDSLDATYVDCPFWSGGPYAPETEAGLLPALEKLPARTLFDTRRKRIVVDFGTTRSYAQGAFSGKTIVTGKLVLTRTKLPAVNG